MTEKSDEIILTLLTVPHEGATGSSGVHEIRFDAGIEEPGDEAARWIVVASLGEKVLAIRRLSGDLQGDEGIRLLERSEEP